MDFRELDEQLGLMVARLELEGEHCHLKHSKADPAENHPAVDYLCQEIGDQETGEVQNMIRIPVCQECAEALYDENWILFYCVGCHSSQWVCRYLSRREYPAGNQIYWMNECPHCLGVAEEEKTKH